ncbi:hypothetical protein [Rhodococcus opacus]|uniref:hypothetical protein n=1 Tax=Rhodococcus opacus TaxID=37919 RepID=UPI0018E480AB|nr:hypothetical protein [Rhodococcus opacus]
MSERTAADVERELTLLAYVRDRLRASEGTDFRIPTTAGRRPDSRGAQQSREVAAEAELTPAGADRWRGPRI